MVNQFYVMRILCFLLSIICFEKVAAQTLFPFKVDNKVGYRLAQEIVIQPQYDAGSPFTNGYAIVQYRGKCGFINNKGKEVINLIFQDASPFSKEGLACVKYDGKYGYIDTTGRWVIPAQYSESYTFNNGFARVNLNGKYGFIDTKGNLAIAAQFDFAKDFSENKAVVLEERLFYFADTFGNKILGPYLSAESFNNGSAWVTNLEKQNVIINAQGLVIAQQPIHEELLLRAKLLQKQ